MDKVLKIENQIVTIGNDNGTIEEYDIGYFNYVPHVNDEVKIYRSDTNLVIACVSSSFEGKNLVKRVTYGLLRIFLGFFCVNEFYAGYTGRGIVCCLFCWTGIPGIVNFIKGILALTETADWNGCIQV